jgi:hypothetical protein
MVGSHGDVLKLIQSVHSQVEKLLCCSHTCSGDWSGIPHCMMGGGDVLRAKLHSCRGGSPCTESGGSLGSV